MINVHLFPFVSYSLLSWSESLYWALFAPSLHIGYIACPLSPRRQTRSYGSVLNSRLWIDWHGQKSLSIQEPTLFSFGNQGHMPKWHSAVKMLKAFFRLGSWVQSSSRNKTVCMPKSLSLVMEHSLASSDSYASKMFFVETSVLNCAAASPCKSLL